MSPKSSWKEPGEQGCGSEGILFLLANRDKNQGSNQNYPRSSPSFIHNKIRKGGANQTICKEFAKRLPFWLFFCLFLKHRSPKSSIKLIPVEINRTNRWQIDDIQQSTPKMNCNFFSLIILWLILSIYFWDQSFSNN